MLILAVVAGGCTATATPDSAALTPNPLGQEIILWYSFGGVRETALLQLVDDFNARNRWRITVAAERLRDVDDLRARVLDGQSRNAMPDLAVADAYVAADLRQAGASVPFDAYVSSQDYGLSQAELADFAFEGGQPRFGGEIVSWPLGREVVVLIYNAKWLGDIGLETPPDYWSEFGDIACAASRDADGDGAFDHFGYAYVADDVDTLAGWLHSRGARIVSPDGSRAEFGDAAGLKAFVLLRSLFDRGCAYQADGPAGAQADFVAGRALFVFAQSNELLGYERAAAAEEHLSVGIAPIPRETISPTVPLFGPDVVLLHTAPSRQVAAWLFVRFLTEPEQSARWAQATGELPARRSVLTSEAMQAYLAAHPLVASAWALAPAAASEESLPGWPAVRSVLRQALRDTVSGERPVEDIVRDAVDRANDALANPRP